VSQGIFVQEQEPLSDLPAKFFLQNVLQLYQKKRVTLRVDSLALWRVNNEEDAVLIPKNEERIFPADFCTRNFWGGVRRCAATPLIAASSSGHSDIIMFHLWSSIATGNNLEHAKKNSKLSRRLGPLTFLIYVQAFWDPLRGELPHVKIFMNDGPNPLT